MLLQGLKIVFNSQKPKILWTDFKLSWLLSEACWSWLQA